jgi:hypothetical protein
MNNANLIESELFEHHGRRLQEQRFLFLSGDVLGDILAVTPKDVTAFADHWKRLTLDQYMGDGGTYRYRRYGEFDAPANAPRRQLPHGPYIQPKYINGLNGGVSRSFDPLEPSFVADPLVNRLLDWMTIVCNQAEGSTLNWNIRLHPYRIIASSAQVGNPTPEGLHRDGVDYIVSMMVSRFNVEGGESTVTDNHRQVLWRRSLQKPMDIVIGQDALTMHAVTPVDRLDPLQEAWRDVLVIAFTRVPP